MKSQVILSPKDNRDYRVSSKVEISTTFPKTFTLWQPPVENQGSVGNCVAQTLANIFETWEHYKGIRHKDFSVGFIYGSSKDYGMTPRLACSSVIKDGDVHRDVWECLEENPICHNKRETLSKEILEKARKMGEYDRITSIEELKTFMLTYNLPIMIVAEAKHYSPFSDGYHATACYGWNENDELLYTNSWGTGGSLGDGRGTITYDKIIEAWGVIPMDKTNKTFTDIEKHWAREDIEEMVRQGIVNGFYDGTFKPDKELTRAQGAVMCNRLLKKVIEILDDYLG